MAAIDADKLSTHMSENGTEEVAQHRRIGGESTRQFSDRENVITSRPCDACRIRKVRCDKGSPCSSCQSLKVPCRVSPKVNERRQRVIISSRYENKIESIDDRLSVIEQILQEIRHGQKRWEYQPAQSQATPPTVTALRKAAGTPPSTASPKTDEENPYEGNTSLLAHSLHAKGLFETLNTYTSTKRSKRLKIALASLQNTLRSQSDLSTANDFRFSADKFEGLFSISDLEMPPLNAVLGLLRTANANSSCFFLEVSVVSFDDFSDLCKSLYFCITNYSPGHFAVVNCILRYLFIEHSAEISRTDASDFKYYASLCARNLELTLENTHLFVNPSLLNCQGLILGAFYATEISKPLISKRLIAIVANMVQSLGYHRLPTTSPETKELCAKKNVFWGVYCLDKALSLRFGYTPILQDCDISTSMLDFPDDPGLRPWYDIWMCYIEFAKFQGQVFSDLYTVSAMSGSQASRTGRARKLAQDLENWLHKWSQIQPTDGTPHQDCLQLALDSNDVVFYGVLTIVYRAIPPSPSDVFSNFDTQCVAAARKSLELHQVVASRFRNAKDIWQGYVNWTLLYSPFAPFMIIFCEAVTTLNLTDLRSLSDFVSSIQPTEGCLIAGVRLYELCAAFYEVAKVYIEERVGQGSDLDSNHAQNLTDSNGVELLLFQPFPNTGYLNSMNTHSMNAHSQEMGSEDFLSWSEDWFLPDQYMTGILDTGFRQQ